MQVNVTGVGTFPKSGALGAYLRVVMSGGNLALAAAGDREIGTTRDQSLASGLGQTDSAAVVLRSAQGTTKMIASGAITKYANVYGAASGKVSATANANPIGIALSATSADGDELEVLRLELFASSTNSTVEAKTADYTVLAADSGKTFTTSGASGTVVFAMPAAVVGMKYRFRVGAAQELRIDPNGSEKVSLPSTGVPGAAGKYLTANADGETVDLECTVAGEWSVFGFTGTWTAEA